MSAPDEKIVEKADKSAQQVAAIDGTRVKAIREAKKLTQLYISNVIGVTIDTVSRWENNRYPSIRRDNAEKLAAALEVELADILRQDQPVLDEAEHPPPQSPSKQLTPRALFLLIVCSILILGIAVAALHFWTAHPLATRWLPRYAAPGEVIPVQIKVSRSGSNDSGVIIREQLPPGWKAVNAKPPSAPGGQSPTGELKWLLPSGSDTVTIYYTVQVSATAPLGTDAPFSGKSVVSVGDIFHTEPIGGNSTVRIGAYHWADSNGDDRIDDNEILPAYYLVDEMKGLGLDWQAIETIWSSGGYSWDPNLRTFAPKK